MARQFLLINRNLVLNILIVLMIVIGVFRIASTYSVFWQTWDEPFHIAAGMEWLDKGKYTYEQFHPPLARVMCAIVPYMTGIRSIGKVNTWDEAWDEGNAILHTEGKYERNLKFARIGILPFFVIAALIVALWANNYAGRATSLLATLLFTTLPPVLAHAGLATLDMACAALVATSLFIFTKWLAEPTALRSILLGITTGLAILSKLSALGFLPAAGGLIAVVYCYHLLNKSPVNIIKRIEYKRWINTFVIALIVCFLSIWAGYRFSYSPLITPGHGSFERIDRIVGTEGAFHDTTYKILGKVPILAPEFFRGVVLFLNRNNAGHVTYFFGDISGKGYWYYFPLIFLAKTPIAFTLLCAIGLFFVLKNSSKFNHDDIQLQAPALAVIGILLVSMLGHVNNGLRQILSLYPILAIIAGYGAFKLLSINNRFKIFGVVLVTVLLSWQIVSSCSAHPDYLTYLNEFARNNPVNYGVDSDLDWGQDLKRLETTLRKRGIHEFIISYNGSKGIKLEQFGLHPLQELTPYQKETGWIAISIKNLIIGTENAPYDQFTWLKDYQPIEKVGQSILLYQIPVK